jgi:hypothetical protein
MAKRIFSSKIALSFKIKDLSISSSSSFVLLTLLQTSTHHEIWTNDESDGIDERHIKTPGFTFELQEQEFLDDDSVKESHIG